MVVELHRKLRADEQRAVYALLKTAVDLDWDFSKPSAELHNHYLQLGAKKGDAIIAAHLHAAGLRWLVSENRHFLSEIPDLPFTLVSAVQAIDALTRSS